MYQYNVFLISGVIFLFSRGPCKDNGLFLKHAVCIAYIRDKNSFLKVLYGVC